MTDLAALVYEKLNLKLSTQQLSAFNTYEKELLDWNENFNLTAIRDAVASRVRPRTRRRKYDIQLSNARISSIKS